MTTYFIQAILGDRFEDLYVTAATPAAALVIAKQQTTLKHRFTRFAF